jgi:glycogen synthase
MSATIGLVFPGDSRSPATWSGTPAGLAAGLESSGVDVLHFPAEAHRAAHFVLNAALTATGLRRQEVPQFRGRVEQSRSAAPFRPEVALLRTRALQRRLRRSPPLDGLVQISTGYGVPPDLPIVTFEEMTVMQAMHLPLSTWVAHSPDLVGARIQRQHDAYLRAAACCVGSRWAAASVVRDYGVRSEKVHVVGFGRNRNPRPVERDWSAPRFLLVGRPWTRKNGPAVVRAFSRLRERITSARLDLVGDHPPVEADGVTGHGTLRLDVPEEGRRLERLYERATCYVMPSHYETFGIAYAEACAAGIPSIGTAVGGAAEVIRPDTGRLVDPADDRALLEAMLELADPATAARMGAAAARRAPLFTWPAVAGRVLRALDLPALRSASLPEFL